MSNHESITTDPDIEIFSTAVADGTSGPELDYDNRWLQFIAAKEGKAETQFNAYEPPNWRKAIELVRELLAESRDLRLAVALLQAKLNIDGFQTLPDSLRLIRNLLQTQWQSLNPRLDPDDGDPYGRLNALEELAFTSTNCFRDFRNAVVINHPQVGRVCIRHFEYALERSPAPEDEEVMSRSQLEAIFNSGLVDTTHVSQLIDSTLSALSDIAIALADNGVESYRHPDFSEIKQCVKNISAFLPDLNAGASNGDDVSEADTQVNGIGANGIQSASQTSTGVMQVKSRKDAVHAIDLICSYLDREEPTNPASMLLKRARRLIDKDFIELIKDLAPESAEAVARMLGVDLSSYESDN